MDPKYQQDIPGLFHPEISGLLDPYLKPVGSPRFVAPEAWKSILLEDEAFLLEHEQRPMFGGKLAVSFRECTSWMFFFLMNPRKSGFEESRQLFLVNNREFMGAAKSLRPRRVFHETWCLKGILKMVYDNHHITGQYNPLFTLNNFPVFLTGKF